jgi:acyl dehydratase
MDRSDLSKIIARGITKYQEKLVGAVLRPEPATREATADAIRRFAEGLGDDNPIWRDPEYAAASPHGGIIAPPAFLNAVHEGQAIVGLPGLISTFVGARWNWYRTIAVNDSFTVEIELLPLEDKSKDGQPRRLLQQGIIRYLNQRGELVGSCRWDMLRSEVKLGESKPKGAKSEATIETHHYSEQDIAAIYAAVDSEQVRGTIPRLWEEVNPGEEVPPVVKGPLALSDMVAWASGISWRRTALAHGPKLRFLRDNSGLSYQNPDTGAPEPIAMSHFECTAARTLMGSLLPMDIGFQRVAWFTHPLTNWMGDAGQLKSIEVRLKGFVRFGDTCWLGAHVVGKRLKEGKHLVDLSLSCLNQQGEKVADGTAEVALTSNSTVSTTIKHKKEKFDV